MSIRHPSQQILSDLEELFPQVASDLRCWEGKNLLITGGTGFFGKWLLEALHFSREIGKIRLGQICVLSRDPEAFVSAHPHLQNFDFIQGDIRSFKFPKLKLHGLIHGATTASAKLNSENPTEMFETIVEGTKQALRCAENSPGCRLLMISSGAVYGKKTLKDGPSKEEDFPFYDRTILGDAYADGKREAERLVVSPEFNGTSVIARCFAFVGPYLPLREHFAIGNFIANVLDGEEILIKGDGSPIRSYLYATELIQTLFRIISRGTPSQVYNVGSGNPISIKQLAEKTTFTAQLLGLKPKGIRIRSEGPEASDPATYFPSVARTSKNLNLETKIDLSQAISRTLCYHLKLSGLKQ